MRKLVVLLVLGILLLGCTSSTAPPAQPAAPTQAPPAGTGPATLIVHIKNFAFSPAQITVNKGDMVQWVNDDSVPHLVKFPDFQSAALANGDTFEHTFGTAGNFAYICGIHASMQGTVAVK
jgi:plastocyanin